MRLIKQPRFWLLVWGAAGTAFLIYVIASASVSPRPAAPAGEIALNPALLTGEMADFVYAFPPRGAPVAGFTHDGATLSLADFRGRAVLVNIWATWCAPCLKELPSLDALEGELGGEKFEVVAVAADAKGPEAAQAYLDRLGVANLKLYTDPSLQFAFSLGGADVLPVSILYDARGQEVGRLVGEADWSSAEARALIASAIPK